MLKRGILDDEFIFVARLERTLLLLGCWEQSKLSFYKSKQLGNYTRSYSSP
jgi:hypothetical protein